MELFVSGMEFSFWINIALSLAVILISWLYFHKRSTRNANFNKIKHLRNAFVNCKSNMKAALSENADKWKAISSLSFQQISTKLTLGELSACDVLHAFQYKAIQCSDRNNCVAAFIETSENVAKQLDQIPESERGPLHGIPVSLKECFLYPGTEATGGFSPYIGTFKNLGTAPIVQFLEKLGAVPFCKTNIPQAMLTFDSRNSIYGTTTNPYDVTRCPGGSSSGEGAILAGGGSILGIGNDVGGSVRIPAAFSGCVALKPSVHRFLNGGTSPGELFPVATFAELLTNGFLTRDVYTMEFIHKKLYSKEVFATFPFESSLAPIPFNYEVFNSTKPLRIAFYKFDGFMECTPSVKRAVEEAKEGLKSKGHTMVEWKPEDADLGILFLCEAVFFDGGAELLRVSSEDVDIAESNKESFLAMRLPNWVKVVASKFYKGFAAKMVAAGRYANKPNDFNDFSRRLRDFRRKFAISFQRNDFDAILCPAFTCPALPFDQISNSIGAATYTTIFNGLNWPAGVLPVTRVTQSDEDKMRDYPGHKDMFHKSIKEGLSSGSVGLPVAVQVAAPTFQEELVLRLMKEIESCFNYRHL